MSTSEIEQKIAAELEVEIERLANGDAEDCVKLEMLCMSAVVAKEGRLEPHELDELNEWKSGHAEFMWESNTPIHFFNDLEMGWTWAESVNQNNLRNAARHDPEYWDIFSD
jgi:hypothetical protein